MQLVTEKVLYSTSVLNGWTSAGHAGYQLVRSIAVLDNWTSIYSETRLL